MLDPHVEELLESLYVQQVESGHLDAGQIEAGPLTAAPAGAAPESAPHESAGDGGQTHSPAAIAQAVALGLIDGEPHRRSLTPQGLQAAGNVVRRHRLAELLLRDVLGVSDEQIDRDACRFEHIIQEGLEEKICVLLGHPRQCPHGKAIPPGPCCRSSDTLSDVSPLSHGHSGGEGSVAYLSTRNQREVQKLMAVGVLPGVPIQLIRRFPSFVFQIDYSQFTVDRELADKIIVHWKKC